MLSCMAGIIQGYGVNIIYKFFSLACQISFYFKLDCELKREAASGTNQIVEAFISYPHSDA